MNCFLGVGAAAALAACGIAQGDVIPFVEESSPPGLDPGLRAWDINVTLSDGVSLPRFGVDASIVEGSFADPDPMQDLFETGGTLADTFFTATSAPPNPFTGGLDPGFSVGPVINSTEVSGNIIDFGLPPGDGEYIIARIISSSDAVYDVDVFISSSVNPDGETFAFTVPSPSGAVLLGGLGAVALRRRRS